MPEVDFTFNSGNLVLEGIIHLPRTVAGRRPAVVLCHPHPLHGGEMNNNVIVAISSALAEREIVALRFNFRGVGGSEGTYDQGRGEGDDLRAAFAALTGRPEVDGGSLGIAGYSFGGMVVLAAVKGWEQVKALAAVAPVISPGVMEGLRVPAYFICGTRDHVVPAELLSREAATMMPPGTVEFVEGVDHFWFGREQEMAGKVADFMAGVLPGTTQ